MQWRVFTDARTEAKAKTVLAKVLIKLGETSTNAVFEPYQIDGFVCSFATLPKSAIWSEVVLESIALAQSVARSWIVSGDILVELDAWSNDSTVVGVQNIHLLSQANA